MRNGGGAVDSDTLCHRGWPSANKPVQWRINNMGQNGSKSKMPRYVLVAGARVGPQAGNRSRNCRSCFRGLPYRPALSRVWHAVERVKAAFAEKHVSRRWKPKDWLAGTTPNYPH